MGAMALHARHSTEQGRASVHRHPDHLVPIVENQTPNETAPRPWWRQRAWAWMLAAALGVRLVFLAHAALADPLLRVLISDADWYHEHARAIATGESFRPGLPHWLPPLYPWVLSLVYRVTDAKKALLDIQDVKTYVQAQAAAALKLVAAQYTYEALKAESNAVQLKVVDVLQERLAVAGVQAVSMTLNELNYAPEIAAAMLKKQQAMALVEARELVTRH